MDKTLKTYVELTESLRLTLSSLLSPSLPLSILPPKLETRLSEALESPSSLDPAVDKPQGIEHGLIRELGYWCVLTEANDGGREKVELAGLDPSRYHPHTLLSLTQTLLPPNITRPPAPSTSPFSLPSPYLPSATTSSSLTSPTGENVEKSFAQEVRSGVGKEVTAVLNVLFSSGGVAGGVWWLGTGSAGWSLNKTVLLTFLSFIFIAAVETTLYVIHFQKASSRKKRDAAALARWEKTGLTMGVPMVRRTLDGETETETETENGEGVQLIEDSRREEDDVLRNRKLSRKKAS
ncbi:ATPase, vacuolar ER assembly factor, Vma12 [Phaffia rhodozyma]|uniref:ATPase, vacuolar ER assembly factor, Vma12 n=1 Tax=Phaffia rhodozyma TaxID=264483 RepID=A0A0F7SSU7_PHARH|nr:ATPase, vacuolar ER assembly factor, Vma12 [Phaffia rhodozyma]